MRQVKSQTSNSAEYVQTDNAEKQIGCTPMQQIFSKNPLAERSRPVNSAELRQLSETAEKHLVALAQEGEKSALNELLQRNWRPVYGVVRRYTQSQEEADDLMQEAMLRAIRKISAFRGEARFSSWLTAIAIRVALSEKRRAKRMQCLPLGNNAEIEPGSYFVEPIESRPSPEQVYIDLEQKHIVGSELQRIAPKYRSILLMNYYGEVQAKDAAKELGISIGTAKSRLYKGRIELMRALRKRENRTRWSAAANGLSPQLAAGEMQ